MTSLFADYGFDAAGFDGYVDTAGGIRSQHGAIVDSLEKVGAAGLEDLQRSAEISLLNQGITFTVYSDDRGTEKIFPLDLLPRLIQAAEWRALERGVEQRLRALNLFLADLYREQRILVDGVVPTDLVVTSRYFCREMTSIAPPGGVFVHVAGIDLIQDEKGTFRVLEDNLRVPSGVSYVLENRSISSRVLPDLLEGYSVREVDHYPRMLLEALSSLSAAPDPCVAVLTPGVHNSAYFEHSFLATQMGVELVEGQDLLVDQDVLYMRTTSGLQKVDVLYRRVDDDFVDPLAFRPDSLLGVGGLMHAYRAGNVALANAPGTGVADDKAMYAYIPDVIRFYLGEEPLLPQVPTYLCRREEDLELVLDRLPELVVKPTDGSGGYGLLIGPAASAEEIERHRRALREHPEHYIAQPVQKLSTLPTWVEEDGAPRLAPRHVDLRPFATMSADGRIEVLPGGLTRVALPRGSLVVNSSQGGGSKDTWVLRPEAPRA
ncbi:MAG: circularly permuted type 2 ATP-grasp protein [Myxococcota bacterium]